MIVVHSQWSFGALRETFEARASEWMWTGGILSLAIVFSLNTKMFYSEAFEGIRELNNNQYFWAAVFATVGVFRLTVLLINGSYYRTPHGRAISAFLCAGVWFMLCIGFARNGSMMIALTPWIFLLDAYNTFRAAKEAGKSEFKQRYEKQQGLKNDRTVGSYT